MKSELTLTDAIDWRAEICNAANSCDLCLLEKVDCCSLNQNGRNLKELISILTEYGKEKQLTKWVTPARKK